MFSVTHPGDERGQARGKTTLRCQAVGLNHAEFVLQAFLFQGALPCLLGLTLQPGFTCDSEDTGLGGFKCCQYRAGKSLVEITFFFTLLMKTEVFCREDF